MLSPETTGKRLLIKECRKHGVDRAALPDAAWDELVGRCVSVAKLTGRFEPGGWRGALVAHLEVEAQRISAVKHGSRDPDLDSIRDCRETHRCLIQ